MNLGSSLRHLDLMGDTSKEYVSSANAASCRTALLLALCIIRSVQFAVEQPRSSKLFDMPWFVYLEQLSHGLGLQLQRSFLCWA